MPLSEATRPNGRQWVAFWAISMQRAGAPARRRRRRPRVVPAAGCHSGNFFMAERCAAAARRDKNPVVLTRRRDAGLSGRDGLRLREGRFLRSRTVAPRQAPPSSSTKRLCARSGARERRRSDAASAPQRQGALDHRRRRGRGREALRARQAGASRDLFPELRRCRISVMTRSRCTRPCDRRSLAPARARCCGRSIRRCRSLA